MTFLYQQTLGREPDQSGFAFWISQTSLALGSMTGDFLDSGEGQASDFQVMAIYQAITGAPPAYDVYLAKLQALRNGTSAQAIFSSLLAASPTLPRHVPVSESAGPRAHQRGTHLRQCSRAFHFVQQPLHPAL